MNNQYGQRVAHDMTVVLEAGEVQRFHTNRMIQGQSIAAHTWGAAVLLDHIYNGNAPPHLMRAVLYHDVPEYYTGDVPAPAKHLLPALSEAIADAETAVLQGLGVWRKLGPAEALILGIVDNMDLCFYCLREIRTGNTGAAPMYHAAKEALLRKVEELKGYRSYLNETTRIDTILAIL